MRVGTSRFKSILTSIRERVSGGTVKSAVDALPLGLVYYHPNGLVKLVNERMERLSWELFGRALQDGNAFWADVVQLGETEGSLQVKTDALATSGCIVTLASGEAYSFTANVLEVAGESLTEVVASDVSEEMAINAQLAVENAQLEEAGRKLAAWADVAAEAVAAREVLEAKARVHDSFGAASIACQRYLRLGGSPETREAMLDQWERASHAMRAHEARLEPQGSVALASIREAGESIGVEVEVTGELPRTPVAARAVTAAAMECLLNASRHAHAQTLRISCTREAGMVRVELTNDGDPPSSDVQEGGGIALVREKVAEAGGTIELTWQPRFSLVCFLPDL